MIYQHLDYIGSMVDLTTYSFSGNNTGTDFSPQTAEPLLLSLITVKNSSKTLTTRHKVMILWEKNGLRE